MQRMERGLTKEATVHAVCLRRRGEGERQNDGERDRDREREATARGIDKTSMRGAYAVQYERVFECKRDCPAT